MNSKTSDTNYRFERIEDRYVSAQCTGLLPSGDFVFALSDPLDGIKTLRVSAEQNYQGLTPEIGKNYDVFLIRQVRKDFWRAALLAQDLNPWLGNRLPFLGTEVRGTVIRFYGDDLAFVALDLGWEAALHISQIPSGRMDRPNISDLLNIGDRIRGTLREINEEQLNLVISILELQGAPLFVPDLAADAENSKAMERQGPGRVAPRRKSPAEIEKNLPDIDIPALEAANPQLLIVDDDQRLAAATRDWLRRYDVSCNIAQTKTAALAAFNRDTSPTHCLVDCSLEDCKEICLEIQNIAPNLQLALWSGNHGLGKKFAATLKLRFAKKPINLPSLANWLAGTRSDTEGLFVEASEIASPLPSQKSSTASSFAQTLAKQVRSQAQTELQQLCHRYRIAGAIWLLQEDHHRYDTYTYTKGVSHTQIGPAVLQARLSIANDTLNAEESLAGSVPRSDPFYPLANQLCQGEPHYVGLKITPAELDPQVLIFFGERSLDASQKTRIIGRKSHFELMASSVALAEYLEDSEVFAQNGRLLSADLHEIRNLLGQVQTTIFKMQKGLATQAIQDIQQDLKTTEDNVATIVKIARDGLEFFRPHRRSRINLNETIRRIAATYEREFATHPDRHGLTIETDLATDRLVTSLDPAAVELALINLIDNAIFHVPKRGGRISVVSRICNSAALPIHIDIYDNGPGIPANRWDTLFKPRTSTRRTGNGLGLYASRMALESIGSRLDLVDSFRWGGTQFRIALPTVLDNMTDTDEPELL